MPTLPFLLAFLLLAARPIHPGEARWPDPGGGRPACPEMLFRGSRLIMEWEGRNEPDSARAVNAALEEYCGWNEQVLRYRILSDTSAGGFRVPPGSADLVLRRLLEYRKRRRWMAGERPSMDRAGREFDYWADPDFDAFTRRKAEAMAVLPGNPDRNLAVNVYAERWDRFESLLKDPRRAPELNREAHRRLEDAHAGPAASVSLFLGAWIPIGNLERVNRHAYPGIRLGLGAGRFNAHLRVGIVLPHGPYRYQVRFEDSLVQADSFAGPSIALEPGFSIFQTLHWKLHLVGGMGYLWAVAYTPPDANASEAGLTRSLSSPEWSLGARLDRLWGMGGAWSVEGRYYILDVGNRGGTPLDGHALAVLLHIGVEGRRAWLEAREIWK